MRTHPRFPLLRIYDLDDPSDIREYVEEMTGIKKDLITGATLDLLSAERGAAFVNLLSMVLPSGTRSIGTACIIAEEYVDRNYVEAYAKAYAKAFRDYPRRTTRYHFFKERVTFGDLFREKRLQRVYQGYAVTSPVEPRTLGRTYILPALDAAAFVTCQRPAEVNLVGNRLVTHGAPFIEQDHRVAACATAALWMTSSILESCFPDPARSASTAEITERATRYSLGTGGGPFPARDGLTVEQMLWALHELGLAPKTYAYVDHNFAKPSAHKQAEKTIYSYVESGLPVILVLGLADGSRHAMTVVGHTYDAAFAAPIPKDPKERTVADSSAWCPRFIGHCDQMGPYLEFELSAANARSEGFPRLRVITSNLPAELTKEVRKFYKDTTVLRIIGPLLSGVDLPPELASIKGWRILLKALKQVDVSLLPKAVLRIRTFLASSNDFRRNLDPKAVAGLSKDLAELYRGQQYSRYVWVTELFAEHPPTTRFDDLRVLAEVVFEETSSPEDDDFITVRLPGLFFSMPPNTSGRSSFESTLASPIAVRGDTPYQPTVLRKTQIS